MTKRILILALALGVVRPVHANDVLAGLLQRVLDISKHAVLIGPVNMPLHIGCMNLAELLGADSIREQQVIHHINSIVHTIRSSSYNVYNDALVKINLLIPLIQDELRGKKPAIDPGTMHKGHFKRGLWDINPARIGNRQREGA